MLRLQVSTVSNLILLTIETAIVLLDENQGFLIDCQQKPVSTFYEPIQGLNRLDTPLNGH